MRTRSWVRCSRGWRDKLFTGCVIDGHSGELLLSPVWACKCTSWAGAGKPLAVFLACVVGLREAPKMGVEADGTGLAQVHCVANILHRQALALHFCQDSALSITCCSTQDSATGLPKERWNFNMDPVELGWTKLLNENVSVCTRVHTHVC